MLIIFILIARSVVCLNANENTGIIQALTKTLYRTTSQEYLLNKKELDNFVSSIELNNSDILKYIQETKNDFLNTSVYFRNIRGTIIALTIGAEINYEHKISPISISIINNDLEITKILIDHGININKIDETEHPPIFWAIYLNNEEIFDLLAEKGADLSFTLKGGKTPMQAAVEIENTKLIELLLKKNTYMADSYKKEIKNLRNKNIKNIFKKFKLISTHPKSQYFYLYQEGPYIQKTS
ncbi:ankyrin repeat domain-containing protein [Borrelia sp. BU AG58]|uniref:ankyrin repeat domain-containing protein n=1 Tax=Borrelia sp. BU AG58 TaxID=2887345 RepID=UPI001E5F3775|nr:ankyrin repeat domain-containing protein [Borrelia sp. BU AG58]UER67576.1 ankyrin repeat domain-containing protein [Borrelia sp. BU AG58]